MSVRHRKCESCKRLLPMTADNFRRSVTAKSGFGNVCKTCQPETVVDKAAQARDRVISSLTPEQRRKMCESKNSYSTKSQALRAQTGYAVSKLARGKPVRAYRCPICKRFHLTTH